MANRNWNPLTRREEYVETNLKELQLEAELKKKIIDLANFACGPFHPVGSKFDVVTLVVEKATRTAWLIVYPVAGDSTKWERVLDCEMHDGECDAIGLHRLLNLLKTMKFLVNGGHEKRLNSVDLQQRLESGAGAASRM